MDEARAHPRERVRVRLDNQALEALGELVNLLSTLRHAHYLTPFTTRRTHLSAHANVRYLTSDASGAIGYGYAAPEETF